MIQPISNSLIRAAGSIRQMTRHAGRKSINAVRTQANHSIKNTLTKPNRPIALQPNLSLVYARKDIPIIAGNAIRIRMYSTQANNLQPKETIEASTEKNAPILPENISGDDAKVPSESSSPDENNHQSSVLKNKKKAQNEDSSSSKNWWQRTKDGWGIFAGVVGALQVISWVVGTAADASQKEGFRDLAPGKVGNAYLNIPKDALEYGVVSIDRVHPTETSTRQEHSYEKAESSIMISGMTGKKIFDSTGGRFDIIKAAINDGKDVRIMLPSPNVIQNASDHKFGNFESIAVTRAKEMTSIAKEKLVEIETLKAKNKHAGTLEVRQMTEMPFFTADLIDGYPQDSSNSKSRIRVFLRTGANAWLNSPEIVYADTSQDVDGYKYFSTLLLEQWEQAEKVSL